MARLDIQYYMQESVVATSVAILAAEMDTDLGESFEMPSIENDKELYDWMQKILDEGINTPDDIRSLLRPHAPQPAVNPGLFIRM